MGDDDEFLESARSNWGTFGALRYDGCPPEQHVSGVEFEQRDGTLLGAGAQIFLQFVPNEQVDADELVFIQAISSHRAAPLRTGGSGTTYENGAIPHRDAAHRITDATQDPSRASDEQGEAHIDTDGRNQDPAYGSTDNVPENELEEGDSQPGGAPGRTESRHQINQYMARSGQKQSDGTWQRPNLQDHPYWMPPEGTPVSGTEYQFETTVLAQGGRMNGQYLGSIQWGFEAVGNRVNKTPFAIRSVGAPTELFNNAARQWNSGQTREGNDSQQLPIQTMSYDEMVQSLIQNPGGESAGDLTNRIRTQYSVQVHITCEDTSDVMSADEIDVQLSGGGATTWREENQTFNDSGSDTQHSYTVALSELLPEAPAEAAAALRNRLSLQLFNGEVLSRGAMGSPIHWNWRGRRQSTVTDHSNYTYQASINVEQTGGGDSASGGDPGSGE